MGKNYYKLIQDNKLARYNFQIYECYEAGLQLYGSEVKSIRSGNVSIKESYAGFDGGELYIYNMHISPYLKANIFNRPSSRRRKLLLRRHELKRLYGKVSERGFTLIPTKIYINGSFIKIEICLAKGKTKYDKRQAIMKRDLEREMRHTQY